jgi:hypothetical protein
LRNITGARTTTRSRNARSGGILYGSEKQHFWYCDPYFRAAFDLNQGGAIIDLRPYAAKLETETASEQNTFRT